MPPAIEVLPEIVEEYRRRTRGQQLNAFPQVSQTCGLTSAWDCMCVVKLDALAKSLPQSSQLYGFSPVWVRMCMVSLCGS